MFVSAKNQGRRVKAEPLFAKTFVAVSHIWLDLLATVRRHFQQERL